MPHDCNGSRSPYSAYRRRWRAEVCVRAGTQMKDWKKLQPALEFATQNLGKNVTLRELAANTEQSRFHAHRRLRSCLGETPKQFTFRLRVDQAAAALATTRGSI